MIAHVSLSCLFRSYSRSFFFMLFESRFDYAVNPQRAEKFYPEIRKYYPDLKDGSLEPGYSGIRPKLSGPKQPPADFVIQVIFCSRKHFDI